MIPQADRWREVCRLLLVGGSALISSGQQLIGCIISLVAWLCQREGRLFPGETANLTERRVTKLFEGSGTESLRVDAWADPRPWKLDNRAATWCEDDERTTIRTE